MGRFSRGNAVIIGGDFNSRVDRPRPLLDEFVGSMGLQEVEVETARHWRPLCDYIFYRGADDVEIRLLASGEASEFVDADGDELSDHPPIFARFTIEALGSQPGKSAL